MAQFIKDKAVNKLPDFPIEDEAVIYDEEDEEEEDGKDEL